MKAIRSFTVRPDLPPRLAALDRLAWNVRWSWHRPTRDLFSEVDPARWESGNSDPRRLLAEVDPGRLHELTTDGGFLSRLDEAAADLDRYLAGERTLDVGGTIAYFSPEFGIAESIPQYSGGLGVLAGDHLKAASDLGVPLVAVGLFYRHGYFRQSLSLDGWQEERFPDLDPSAASMTLCDRVRVSVELGDEELVAQVWRVDVGRTPLFLLDSDIDENADHLRLVTDRLYGGDTEHRLRQEMLLGIGGVRALRALGITATVFHTTEGHAGFLGLERIRVLMADDGLTFAEALEATRSGGVFTTHTPVPAGIDRFPLELIERYFAGWAAEVGLTLAELFAIGHRPSDPADERFNMAVMGMRLAAWRNGVAALHGEVSREMFADLWPGVPVPEVPVGSVTNGVHGRTWTSREINDWLTATVGSDWEQAEPSRWKGVADADHRPVWEAHLAGKRRLVEFARTHLRDGGVARGLSLSEVAWCDDALDPDVLTICFARRFATYKRATLLLSQPERLRRLLLDADRPVQFVFAGKSHPADDGGKQLIRQVVAFSHDPEIRARFCFLDDYDMRISRALLHGADVWLNTPLRPYEACGTSGMKAAMNGAINCSILDGWWAECFTPDVGWAISSAPSISDEERRDEVEANSLFELIESQIVPLYYRDDDRRSWVQAMCASMAQLTPFISAHRMMSDYVTQLYRPADGDAVRMGADGYRGARDLAAWKARVRDAWHLVHVDAVEVDESLGALGGTRDVAARVHLGELTPDDVDVQVLSGTVGQAGELEGWEVVSLRAAGSDDDGHLTFAGEIALSSAGRRGVTARVVPRHPSLESPLDLALITWAD